MSALHAVIVSNAEPASGICMICCKPLPKTGMAEVALMFDQDGQPKGWAHKHHVPDLPLTILRQTRKAMCARCGLPMVGDHAFYSTGETVCRDGGEFVMDNS